MIREIGFTFDLMEAEMKDNSVVNEMIDAGLKPQVFNVLLNWNTIKSFYSELDVRATQTVWVSDEFIVVPVCGLALLPLTILKT